MTKFNINEYLNNLDIYTNFIDLSYKNLYTIPDLNNFIKLEKLNLSGNKISNIGNLPESLIELNLSYNKLINIDY